MCAVDVNAVGGRVLNTQRTDRDSAVMYGTGGEGQGWAAHRVCSSAKHSITKRAVLLLSRYDAHERHVHTHTCVHSCIHTFIQCIHTFNQCIHTGTKKINFSYQNVRMCGGHTDRTSTTSTSKRLGPAQRSGRVVASSLHTTH